MRELYDYSELGMLFLYTKNHNNVCPLEKQNFGELEKLTFNVISNSSISEPMNLNPWSFLPFNF